MQGTHLWLWILYWDCHRDCFMPETLGVWQKHMSETRPGATQGNVGKPNIRVLLVEETADNREDKLWIPSLVTNPIGRARGITIHNFHNCRKPLRRMLWIILSFSSMEATSFVVTPRCSFLCFPLRPVTSGRSKLQGMSRGGENVGRYLHKRLLCTC